MIRGPCFSCFLGNTDNPDCYQQKVQKLVSVMVWGCVSVTTTGSKWHSMYIISYPDCLWKKNWTCIIANAHSRCTKGHHSLVYWVQLWSWGDYRHISGCCLWTCDSAIVPNNEPFCRVEWDYSTGEKSHGFTGERRRRPTESWPVAAVRQMVFSLCIWLKCSLHPLFVVRKTEQQHICFRLLATLILHSIFAM